MDLPMLNYKAAQFWISVVHSIALLGLFVYTHMANKSKVNANAINAVRGDLETTCGHLQDRISRTERRQDVFETKLDSAPTHQDLSKVYERLNDVAESLSGARGQMSALSQQLSLVNDYLLNNKGNRR